MKATFPNIPSIHTDGAFNTAIVDVIDAAVKLEASKNEGSEQDLILEEYNEASIAALIYAIDAFCLRQIARRFDN